MPRGKCAWGTCNSDGRYTDREHMQNVQFYTFPKPVIEHDDNTDTIKCREWIRACGRPFAQLNIKIIDEDVKKRKYYYKVCSKVLYYTISNTRLAYTAALKK